MEYDLDAALCKAAKLIEIAEGIEKGGSPGIAPASGIGRLRDPDKSVWFETVAKDLIEFLSDRSGWARNR